MKKTFLLLAIFIAPAIAEQKFMCVDPGRILQESKLVKTKETQLRSKVEDYQKQLDQINRRLEDLKKQIESKAIAQKVREEKIKEYQRLESEGLELQQKANKELSELKGKMEEEIGTKVKAIAEEIGKKQGLTGIIDCSALLYRSPEIDITQEVIQRLDQQK